MKTCRVKPENLNICMSCMDIQIESRHMEDCNACTETSDECEIIQFYNDIFGRCWAIVINGPDRTVRRVPIHRIFDVKEKGE